MLSVVQPEALYVRLLLAQLSISDGRDLAGIMRCAFPGPRQQATSEGYSNSELPSIYRAK
jgi:hypothetical protein